MKSVPDELLLHLRWHKLQMWERNIHFTGQRLSLFCLFKYMYLKKSVNRREILS